MPLFTIINFGVQGLCYESVCQEGKDPIDFSDLNLISIIISRTRANGFYSHLFLRSILKISFQDHFHSYRVPTLGFRIPKHWLTWVTIHFTILVIIQMMCSLCSVEFLIYQMFLYPPICDKLFHYHTFTIYIIWYTKTRKVLF